MIDHCVHYFKRKKEEQAFRVNVTEIVRGLLGCMTGNIDEIPRYIDAIKPPEPEKEVSAESVIGNIRKKLGG